MAASASGGGGWDVFRVSSVTTCIGYRQGGAGQGVGWRVRSIARSVGRPVEGRIGRSLMSIDRD